MTIFKNVDKNSSLAGFQLIYWSCTYLCVSGVLVFIKAMLSDYKCEGPILKHWHWFSMGPGLNVSEASAWQTESDLIRDGEESRKEGLIACNLLRPRHRDVLSACWVRIKQFIFTKLLTISNSCLNHGSIVPHQNPVAKLDFIGDCILFGFVLFVISYVCSLFVPMMG